MEDLAIGIDLGTTNSCVSLHLNGKTRILENSEGGRITPSFIFFTSLDETLVGEHAKRIAATKPTHGIYEVKRLVGRTFSDSYIQNSLKYLPFKVEADSENNPLVVIEQKYKTLKKTPQELCAAILQKLKNDVEAKLGTTVNKVVITVPAYFNVTQREVTLAAAKDVGFTVLKLLNEPTAAALSYYFENDCTEKNYSLVYDLGGGTFDVAILKRSVKNIDIIGVNGDTQLGGHDFDNLIVNYVCDKLKEDYDYDPRCDKENLRRLRNKCEDAKKALSAVQETVIVLTGFVPNHPSVQIRLTRQQFEEIVDELLQKTIKIMDVCMRSSRVSKSSIKEVILSGGSTRIPKIQKILSDYFNGKTLKKFVNPDECVAEGAALQAAMLSKNSKQSIQKITLRDVIPLSLGTADYVDRMEFHIRRNSRIPVSRTLSWATVNDKQTSMELEIFEGERINAKMNRLIGEVTISNITEAPPGKCDVSATMKVDENGILTVVAKEIHRNNVKRLKVDCAKVNYARGGRSEREIQNALIHAEKFKKEDDKFRQFAKVRGYLWRYCVAVMYNLDIRKLSDSLREIYELCKETVENCESMELDQEDSLKKMIKEVRLRCEPTVEYYNFDRMPQLVL